MDYMATGSGQLGNVRDNGDQLVMDVDGGGGAGRMSQETREEGG